MKNANSLLILAAALLTLNACSPKNEPRYVQEGKKVWTPVQAPDDESVEATSLAHFDLSADYARVRAKDKDLMGTVLKPLAPFVLNAKFVETPANHTTKLSETIGVFDSALLIELERGNDTADFKLLKEDFYNTVFSGCTRDLRRGCQTADLFAQQPLHSRIMTLLARELDPRIEALLKETGSADKCVNGNDECRNLIEERYRRLAMAIYNKRSRYDDSAFDFAYLKYARLFALYLEHGRKQQMTATADADFSDMSYSYLADTNGKLFQTLIARYQPHDFNSPEFKAFVENFNPWTYSNKRADLFQYGTGVMFEFGTKCCLYQDTGKTKISPAVSQAIEESQKDSDQYGLSFRQMIDDIKKDHGYRLFDNLGVRDLVRRIEQPGSGFYNEYFFIVDRLFRGHLTSAEVDKVLRNVNQARARVELPRMATDYIKIYMVYMVVETNRFMAGIYHSNIASDKVFQEAIVRSRELTDRWHTIQSSIDLLDKLLGSYFKGLNLASSPEYDRADKILKSVDRNVHYLSVFPNMIVMNYYLSKMNGTITVDSWWGRIEIDADTILKSFFDGNIGSPWFHFGIDTESLDRLMLLYSTEYLLSTEALSSFVAKDAGGTGNDRSKFFDVIFSKYLGDSISDLREKITNFERDSVGNPAMALTDAICGYEMGRAGGLPPHIEISFLELSRFTYSGLGDNGVNKVLNGLLGGAKDSIDLLRTQIEYRRVYVQAMMHVIAQDLLRSGKIKRESDAHPDLDKARDLLKQLDDMQAELATTFITRHKHYFSCATRLLEIERRRANRLYDEERAHLGRVFDLMKPLAGITDAAALNAKVNEINESYFRKAGSGYRFDRLDGLTYRMSKYDLLMRMKQRIEADVFTSPSAHETSVYGDTTAEFTRPRSVSVYLPDGLERDDMVNKGTSTAVYFRGTSDADRENFIHQGLSQLNGKAGSFVEWQRQFSSDTGLLKYLTTLEEFYLLGPVRGADGQVVQVSKEDLTDAFVKAYASFSLDAFDVQNAVEFGVSGRFDKGFYEGSLFERDGRTRLPLFRALMSDINKLADVSLKGSGPVREALDFARGFNSMQAFVFDPSSAVRDTVRDLYGRRSNQRLQRVADLYGYLGQLEASVTDAGQLDRRLTQPYYVEGSSVYGWYNSGFKNLLDRQIFEDHKVLIDDFIQQSGDFYSTREKVKVP